MSDFFDKPTIAKLSEKLAKEDIKSRKGTGTEMLSYLASHHVIAEANRIFGFGNWATEVMSLKQVDRTEYEKPPYKAGDPPKQMISISFLCHTKLTIQQGDRSVSHEDTGFGNGVAGANAYGIGSCIELASKEAVTDALKRCLRYYGDKFGLSLYDKDNAPMTLPEIEAAKIVTAEQLKELRDLYPDRGIDDEWVLSALHAEHYPHDSLEVMRFDWYQMALKITREYKLAEIERQWYDLDIKKCLDLMEQSANMNMLKALFKEAWGKTQKYEDKETQAEAQKIYESMKKKLEKTE